MTKYKIKIEQDTDPINPRTDYDNFGEMICFHRRYILGDEHDYKHEDYDGWNALYNALRKEEDPAEVVLPLYLYDHSSITISTGPFSCPWDSGQIGFIIARRSKILREFSRKRISPELRDRARQILEGEVKTYDQYLTGDV